MMRKQNPGIQLLRSVGGIIVLVLLIKCFIVPGNKEPASSSDPALLNIYETTIRDLENFRNEMQDLAAEADATPVEDLEQLINQMNALIQDPQKNHDVPPFAALAKSALIDFAWNTKQCYSDKYDEYIGDDSGLKFAGDRCEQAKYLEGRLDLYLQELKEMYTEE